ncbi:acid phosphatase [Sphingomonas donggukensis]|uniref:Acid phosphatase n=1 Tax=Sphingomonas donggukensis TaxID=2949093 RepID=A0ABY4TPU3_9SPHN|nr:HAD family acid phosphatase [Sphingomonas donggukensis]URW74408.1 acid phosphatase [Sphingomonas donggukensis]
MIRALAAVSLMALTSGCIAAAVVPIAASSSAIVKSRMAEKRAAHQGAAPQTLPAPSAGEGLTNLVPTLKERQVGAEAPPAPGIPATLPARGVVPEGMQYLYGSGEASAGSIQAYRALQRYLADIVTYGKKGAARQVVLSDGASLNAPQFEPCGPKPLAVVLDIDETAVLNLGYEADAARRGESYDAARWSRWEQSGADKVVAVPGAKMALDAARAAGITVIFNSNRLAENAAATEAALAHAGLGPAKHGTTLWLKGDDGGGSGKDDRRWAIASGYCVIALVGDQLGDFSDLFNEARLAPSTRRALAGSPALAALWGNGWFMLPNPVYGTALKGSADEIFPHDMRWTDPGPAATAPAAGTAVQPK